MEVIRAEILGFCSGVRRAVNAASEALDENEKKNGEGVVYTFGPLIHNPTVLEKLSERGLKVCSEKDFENLKEDDTVLIRAHGVPPEIENSLKEKVKTVINATCPLVTMSQKKAADFASKNYNIIFAGDKNHGEVIGIEGYAVESYKKNGFEPNFILVRDEADMKSLFVNKRIDLNRKTVLLSQTTFSIPIFEKLTEFLKEKISDVEIVSSICPATHERRVALERLCKEVEGVLVIGGKTSANSNRLYAAAQKLCKKTAFIETEKEIPDEFFSLGKVGITAGASTPDDVIDAVEKCLLSGK